MEKHQDKTGQTANVVMNLKVKVLFLTNKVWQSNLKIMQMKKQTVNSTVWRFFMIEKKSSGKSLHYKKGRMQAPAKMR